ncbi:MAG: carbohydrate ABC transporter permease [Deinococcus sp.]|nr:carbohydrate ABC transporter permease [Deinococcus sp.]
MVLPFLYMISTAFKPQAFVLELPPRLIPQPPTFDNFLQAWRSNSFGRYFGNSLAVALCTTALSVLLSAMLAYAFAEFEFPGKGVVFYALLVTLMIPSLMLIIPQFLLIKALGLRNTLTGLVVMYTASSLALNTFLLRGFFEDLPRELAEAALIDGGGYWTIFWRLALPLVAPALATAAIFTFLYSWDEFTLALTLIDDASKRTLPVAIATFHGAHLTQWGLVFAASLIAVGPVILVFVLLQRYIVRGLTSGAVRG